MKQLYTLQKYVFYNSIRYNLFEYNSTLFLINYFNTILYFSPHNIKILLKHIKNDIVEYNTRYHEYIDEYEIYNLLLQHLDKNHTLYKKYKIILEYEIQKILLEYSLISKNHKFLNFIKLLCI